MLCLKSLTNNLNWVKNKKQLMHFTFMPCDIRIFIYMITNRNCTHENTLTFTYICPCLETACVCICSCSVTVNMRKHASVLTRDHAEELPTYEHVLMHWHITIVRNCIHMKTHINTDIWPYMWTCIDALMYDHTGKVHIFQHAYICQYVTLFSVLVFLLLR